MSTSASDEVFAGLSVKDLDKRADLGSHDEELYLYRWGHSLVSVPSIEEATDGAEYLDSMLMIGGIHKALAPREDGRDQILVKNMPTLSINSDLTSVEIVAKSGEVPPIFGHSCRYVRGYYLVICIGGFDTASDIFLPRSIYGVFVYDIQYGSWKSVAIESLNYDNGTLVSEYGIAESSMEIVKISTNMAPIVVVVGGRSQCYNCYSNYKDTVRQRAKGYMRYNVKNRGIKIINVLIEPAGGVYGHCTVADGNSVYVLFGGLPFQGPAPIIRRFQVYASKDGYGYYTTSFENLVTNSPVPSPRVYPTCYLYNKQIVVFGGLDLTQNGAGNVASVALQDSWKFDIPTFVWTRLKESSRSGPGPRWRSASAIVATSQDNNNSKLRQYNNNYDLSKDNNSVTGMILHGGLTTGAFKEDQKFYTLRNAINGGWKGSRIETNNVRPITVSDQVKPTQNSNYYITAAIILGSVILLVLLAYLLRYLIKKISKHNNIRKKSKTSLISSPLNKSTSSLDGAISEISRQPPSLSSNYKKKNGKNGENIETLTHSSSLNNIPSVLSKAIPSVIASKHKDRSPPNTPLKKPLNNKSRNFSSASNLTKNERTSSISWVQDELQNKFPEFTSKNVAPITATTVPKTLTESNSYMQAPEFIDLSRPYVAIQSFNAQRYDEVSLTRGDLCTMRLVFKDNWAVGMNLTLRKTGIIPVACLQIDVPDSSLSSEAINTPFQESNSRDGIACFVSLEYQRSLKDLDQLLESRAITIDQYLDRRRAILRHGAKT